MATKKVTKKEEPKKVKLNDKVNKKKNKSGKYISDEAREIRNFAIILISIIVIVLIVYGVTKVLKGDDSTDSGREITAGEIDYDIVSIGTMLNRSEKDYYVMIYDSTASEAVRYSAIITKYMYSEDAKTIYFCDLNNKLNSDYYIGSDGTSNPKATDLSDLALKDLTLIRVKNGKIVKYIEDLDKIKSELNL